MNILVTGGRGYLGGRIARSFLDLGHTVSISTRQHVKGNFSGKSIKFIDLDWSSPGHLAQACKGMDVVIHAAGMNAEDCLSHPDLAIEFNGNATERLAIASEQSGVKKFIYISTARVYSDQLANFIDENSPTRNKHPYATSHLLGERGVIYSKNLGKMQRCVLRLSNVYGKPEEKRANCWKLVVNDMARQVSEHGSILLKTNGKQERDFVTISDLLNFIAGISRESFCFEQPQIINFGSGISTSIIEMASLISEISQSVFEFSPAIKTTDIETRLAGMPLEYSSKYNSFIKQFRKNDVRQEIRDLLIYSKDNFHSEKIQ
jgi:UDP-glucose 4-epimerase